MFEAQIYRIKRMAVLGVYALGGIGALVMLSVEGSETVDWIGFGAVSLALTVAFFSKLTE